LNAQLRAGLLLALYVAWTMTAPPGMDYLSRGELATEKQRAKKRAQYGTLPTAIAIGVTTANRARISLVDHLLPVQRLFRVEQSWSFYPAGLRKLHRLEVWIDGELVYRTGDDDYAWMEPQLTNGRLRPLVQATVVTHGARNAEGIARLVVTQAHVDFPDAREVVLKGTSGRFPGEEMTVDHTLTAAAPDWVIVAEQ